MGRFPWLTPVRLSPQVPVLMAVSPWHYSIHIHICENLGMPYEVMAHYHKFNSVAGRRNTVRGSPKLPWYYTMWRAWSEAKMLGWAVLRKPNIADSTSYCSTTWHHHPCLLSHLTLFVLDAAPPTRVYPPSASQCLTFFFKLLLLPHPRFLSKICGSPKHSSGKCHVCFFCAFCTFIAFFSGKK